MLQENYLTCALYKFVAIPEFKIIRPKLKKIMDSNNVFGTILLASEGINGTISGLPKSVLSVVDWLEDYPGIGKVEIKKSYSKEVPFYRSKVKIKKEIVTMGVEKLDSEAFSGEYVEPDKWNELISDPDVLVIDTRNDYEVSIGSFDHAVDPGLKTFKEFPQWADKNLHTKKNKKIAMFCTGGIRCEKSTALLKKRGFDEVYHLKGGILNYLSKVPETDSLWTGECFVFDNRVTVNHSLEQGSYDQCHACRRPITEEDKVSERYEKGVSCDFCFAEVSEERKSQFAERQKQVDLAKNRGEDHIGKGAFEANKKRKLSKRNRFNSVYDS